MRKTILALMFILALMILLVYTHPLLTTSAKKNECTPGGPLSLCDPDGQKSYREFRATIKSYPYSASAERKERVLKNYQSLRVGMTKKDVSSLLGDPDYSELGFGPKGPGEHWLGSDWQYDLFIREEGIVNMNDPRIEIFFGTDGLLSWAVPSGLPQLHEVGACCKRSGQSGNDQ